MTARTAAHGQAPAPPDRWVEGLVDAPFYGPDDLTAEALLQLSQAESCLAVGIAVVKHEKPAGVAEDAAVGHCI